MLATISDVAKRAGVSTVTVSRVINNVGNVSASTQTKVLKAIEELGYVPSGVAQSLRSKRTLSLALIVPDIQNGFWTTVARGVEDAAQSRGYSVLLCNTDENPAKQRHYLDVVISQRVDGVAIAPCDSDPDNLKRLIQRDIPTVVIDRHVNGWDVDTVTGDSISGSRALVRHLIQLGHRRIAMISGPINTSTAADRVAGYRIALAEARIPYDPELVKFGEFRSISGERLTHQLLSTAERPTAIFAANNAIAMGVIDALDARELRIPDDIALVCFDDLPNTSRLFPFLTVVVQLAYDIGANAAQLLLSRLETSSPLSPRHVVLPTRLVVRHSCGSSLVDEQRPALRLPLRREANERLYLVKPMTPAELRAVPTALNHELAAAVTSLPWRLPRPSNYDKPDFHRILQVFDEQLPDRVPHFELEINHRDLYEQVLERKPQSVENNDACANRYAPKDQVELAHRLGVDAVACDFSWCPNSIFQTSSDGRRQYVGGTIKSWADLDHLEPPPPLADQLNRLERFIRAAEGTGVGIFASFSSFFLSALRAVGMQEALLLVKEDRLFIERLMDSLLEYQDRVIRAVCDRFASELVFILIRDEIAHRTGPLIAPELLETIYVPRMERMLAPASIYGKPLMIHTPGQVQVLLPMLRSLGFQALHPIGPESNDIFHLKKTWGQHFVLSGNFPVSTLMLGTSTEIESQVKEMCMGLGTGGGYIFSCNEPITQGIPARAYMTMVQALHKYGRPGTDESLLESESKISADLSPIPADPATASPPQPL